MPNLRISLITVAFNAQNTIERCIESVMRQKFNNVQYIVIDGGSTDDTNIIINKYRQNIDLHVSEPDKGVYDAMNKGIALATGDIVGILNADDYFADDEVLGAVAMAFFQLDTELVYGDLDYVTMNGDIVRKWRSGNYHSGKFNRGWMPPHPTFYCRRRLFEEFGNYSLEYGTAADYELMLRFIHAEKKHIFYIKKVMVKMVIGGISNQSFRNRLKALRYDLKAMRNNGILFPLFTIILKPLRKVLQFV